MVVSICEATDALEEIADAFHVAQAGDVVDGEAAARRELGEKGLEVVQGPVLVGVDEDEIERSVELPDELAGVAQAGVDEAVEPRGLEVPGRGEVTELLDLDGDQGAAGLAQGPGLPDPRVPGRRPDLEGARVALLEDEIVEELAVGFGDVLFAPLVLLGLEELTDALVESLGMRGGLPEGEGEERRAEEETNRLFIMTRLKAS